MKDIELRDGESVWARYQELEAPTSKSCRVIRSFEKRRSGTKLRYRWKCMISRELMGER